jgi:glycosyltransferase involved in cell wall biosynthesis
LIKLVDLTYHSHLNYTRPEQVKENHAPALAFASYLKNHIDFTFVKHASFEQCVIIDDVPYYFFKGKNRFWSVSVKTHQFIKKLQPDIVLVQGFMFPLQVVFLRLFCGNNFKILIQHHSELPFSGVKGLLQKISCSLASGFVFTAAGDALPWIKANIIKPTANIFELLEASTNFTPKDKLVSKERTGMTGDCNFLWVGRLTAHKDPLTVVNGFEQYLYINPAAKLYMIYPTDDLLNDIKQKLNSNPALSKAVKLMGKVPNSEMPYWYSAADCYVSGSQKDSTSYALLEALACGCTPVITNIPSFKKITGNGKCGFLYPPGNAGELALLLGAITNSNKQKLSDDTLNHFNQNLTTQNIATDLIKICENLMTK